MTHLTLQDWTVLIAITVFVLWQPFTIHEEVFAFLTTGLVKTGSLSAPTPMTYFVYAVNFAALGLAIAAWYLFLIDYLPGNDRGERYDLINGFIFAAIMVTKLYPIALTLYGPSVKLVETKNKLKLRPASWALVVAFFFVWAAIVIVYVLFAVYSLWTEFGLWSLLAAWSTFVFGYGVYLVFRGVETA